MANRPMLKIVRVHRAQPIVDDEPVDKVTIKVDKTMPRQSTLEEAYRDYEADAKKIADALEDSLPGGTFSALLIELLERKKCYLVVPHRRARGD